MAVKKLKSFRAYLLVDNPYWTPFYDNDGNETGGWLQDTSKYSPTEAKLADILQKAVSRVNKNYSLIGLKIEEGDVSNYRAVESDVQYQWTNSFLFKHLPVIRLNAVYEDGSFIDLFFGDGFTLDYNRYNDNLFTKNYNTVQPTNVDRISESIIFLHNYDPNSTDGSGGYPGCNSLFPWWCNRQRLIWLAAAGAAGYFAASRTDKAQKYALGAVTLYGTYRFLKLGGFGGFFEKLPKLNVNGIGENSTKKVY